VVPWQTGLAPDIGPAASGDGWSVRDREAGVPSPQVLLCPFTLMVPETAFVLKSTVTEFVPLPVVIDAPNGNVHVYELAPMIGDMA